MQGPENRLARILLTRVPSSSSIRNATSFQNRAFASTTSSLDRVLREPIAHAIVAVWQKKKNVRHTLQENSTLLRLSYVFGSLEFTLSSFDAHPRHIELLSKRIF
jgi:hypothetical protein